MPAASSETRADIYMGHADGGVQRRYRHPDQLAEDAQRLDEFLRGSREGRIATLPLAAAG